MLADMVRRGELPPVEERLPAKPLVLESNVAPGQHGGDLRMVVHRSLYTTQTFEMGQDGATGLAAGGLHVGAELTQEAAELVTEPLLAFNQNLTLRPSLAESWEYNEDATQLTLRLRRGVRWSDGTLFTTEDILFHANHYPGRQPVGDRVVAADDYTITFRRDNPDPQVVMNFALFEQQWPAHHLKPYHIAFSKEALLRVVAESRGTRTDAKAFEEWVAGGGLGDLLDSLDKTEEALWAESFLSIASPLHAGRPILGPWQVEGQASAKGLALWRNPYYWQIDAEGRQLPYLDRVAYVGAGDRTVFQMAFANGEVGMQALELSPGDLDWLRAHQLDGDYRVDLCPGTWHLTLHVNLATSDPRLQPFFNDVRVRRALMLGIDRESLNHLHYDGLCTPRQFSPLHGTRFYDEGLSTGWIAYDPDRANAVLDEAGYAERDGEGYRLHADWSPVTLEIIGATQPDTAEDGCALSVVGHLLALGLECSYRRVQAADFGALLRGNTIQAAWMPNYNFPLLPTRALYTLLGHGINHQPWAGAYGYHWYASTTGDSRFAEYGVEPPEDHWIRDLWRICERMGEETDQARWDAAFRELLQIWAAQVPLIGILGQMPQPVVVHNDLRNYVDGLPYDPQVGGIDLQNPQQLYWEHPEEHVYAR